MKQFLIIVVCLVILGYMWRDQIRSKVNSTLLTAPKQASMACEVNGTSCDDLVRMLNALRSGRYYEGAAKLVGVTPEGDAVRRSGGAMVFSLPDGRTLIHNQGVVNLEQGYLTVKMQNGHWLKYNDKGIFVDEGD